MMIEYRCADGSRTVARWPSIALLHWLGRTRPMPRIENPEPFKPYIVASPVPGDTDPLFLTLVFAACESRWNRQPPFEVIPPGGQAYQDRCLDVLRWLHEIGDIVALEIEEDRE